MSSGRRPGPSRPSRPGPRRLIWQRPLRIARRLEQLAVSEWVLRQRAVDSHGYQGDRAQPSNGLNQPVMGDMPILLPAALVEMTVPLPRLIAT